MRIGEPGREKTGDPRRGGKERGSREGKEAQEPECRKLDNTMLAKVKDGFVNKTKTGGF